MNRKVLLLSLMILICCFYATGLPALDPFAKRITHIVNHKDFYNSINYINQDGSYYYSDTEPALLDSINLLTINNLSSGYSEIYLHSEFTHTYQTVGENRRIDYYEYRDGNPVWYAYYKFVFNPDGYLVESLQQRPSLNENNHFYIHYLAPNQPDSIYFSNTSNVSYYKLFYSHNILQYSYRYMSDGGPWYLAYRYLLTYGQNPYHYPTTLDFSNYRFYIMNGGGFEDSYPIHDMNYAPQSIAYEYWDDWDYAWYPNSTSFYDVETYETEIALINGQYGSYTGYFFFDENGTYTHKRVEYTNGDVTNFTMTWSDPVSNEDNTSTPPVRLINTYPNPFSNHLNIRLDNCKAPADISIYNIKGQLIRSWKDIRAGELTWDGKNSSGKQVSAGVYLIRLDTDKQAILGRVVKL
jgi:hypothetical protein